MDPRKFFGVMYETCWSVKLGTPVFFKGTGFHKLPSYETTHYGIYLVDFTNKSQIREISQVPLTLLISDMISPVMPINYCYCHIILITYFKYKIIVIELSVSVMVDSVFLSLSGDLHLRMFLKIRQTYIYIYIYVTFKMFFICINFMNYKHLAATWLTRLYIYQPCHNYLTLRKIVKQIGMLWNPEFSKCIPIIYIINSCLWSSHNNMAKGVRCDWILNLHALTCLKYIPLHWNCTCPHERQWYDDLTCTTGNNCGTPLPKNPFAIEGCSIMEHPYRRTLLRLRVVQLWNTLTEEPFCDWGLFNYGTPLLKNPFAIEGCSIMEHPYWRTLLRLRVVHSLKCFHFEINSNKTKARVWWLLFFLSSDEYLN